MKIFELDPDFDPSIWERFITNLKNEGTLLFTTRHRRKDGEIMDVEIVANYVTRDGSEYSFAFARDITSRKRAEEKLIQTNKELQAAYEQLAAADEGLRENERKFRAIFDQTFQFIGLMTPDGTMVEANRTALKFSGIEESDVLGKPFWETPWWTHSRELQEKLRAAIKDAAAGEFVRFEAIHLGVDGSLHYIDFSLKPVTDETGKVLLLIPEGRDITDSKRTHQDLLQKNEELNAAYRSDDCHRAGTPDQF